MNFFSQGAVRARSPGVQRMGAEKAAAFAESWNAMALQALQANPMRALSFLRAFWSPASARSSAPSAARQVGRAAMGIVQKGLAPVHRCIGAPWRTRSA